MTRFLIFYLIAYGGTHIYLFWKFKGAFSLSPKKQLLCTLVLTSLFTAPLIARKLESFNLDRFTEIFSGVGYLWMGLLFLFVTASASIDVLNLCSCKTGFKISPKNLFLTSAAYTLIIGTYGYYEAINIVTEYVTIKSNRIPASVGRIRIVQISDVHVGQIVRERRIRTILDKVKAAAPDILVSTGDLVDGHQKHFDGLERLFLEVHPKLGKYAIPGNHEYYVGIDESEKFMRDAGFKVLKNENFELGRLLHITGVDDSRNKVDRVANAIIEERLLESAQKGEFRLLLKHRPVIEKSSAGKFDLQLSGHVHKGQIFPFNFLTWLSFPVRSGHTILQSGAHLYVSRGTGVWGPPIRFLAPKRYH
jgi:predicted MPP superfamily phosphohydrolase